jgi:hypothetical protein
LLGDLPEPVGIVAVKHVRGDAAGVAFALMYLEHRMR